MPYERIPNFRSPFPPVRNAWLNQRQEDVISPDWPIVDAHHHLLPAWAVEDGEPRYLLKELLADTSTGHNIVATVFAECEAMYKDKGPDEWRSLGETEFVTGVAAMSDSGLYGTTQACAAIVGSVDLLIGARVKPILERHKAVGGERFAGIRNLSSWADDPAGILVDRILPRGLLSNERFREGLRSLRRLKLSFDACLFHLQLQELNDLAAAYPETAIILDHVAQPFGIGKYAGRQKELYQEWKRGVTLLAKCPNVSVKIGGLGMFFTGFGLERREMPSSSKELVGVWAPFVESVIQAFGPNRCMFESNFPVDKAAFSYPIMWNAFKMLSAGYSPEERADLFALTASRVYGLREAAATAKSALAAGGYK